METLAIITDDPKLLDAIATFAQAFGIPVERKVIRTIEEARIEVWKKTDDQLRHQ